ncbi:MAG: hypothetical protein RIE31_11945 [Alphaproteobacteria bacterium]
MSRKIRNISSLLAAPVVVIGLMLGAGQASAQEAHAHIGHITTTWALAPNQLGLLPAANAEAFMALSQAGLMVANLSDLAKAQEHARNVIHAIDPAFQAEGPALNYGVRAAAQDIITHVNLAAASPDASDNVKLHAEHVATSAQNVIERSELLVAQALGVLAASSSRQAAPFARAAATLADQIIVGVDVNGDGQITWAAGEGGLNQVSQHMDLMVAGEDMMMSDQ